MVINKRRKRMTDLTIMYSGGLDSFISWHYARSKGYKPFALFVDLGQPYGEKERYSIKRQKVPVTTLNMESLYEIIQDRLTNQIIPSRNVMLGVIGSMFNSRIWINALDGEQTGKEHDKSERFFEDTSKLLTFTNEFFQPETIVESPFADFSKAETIKWALDNDIKLKDLFKTSTCYDPNLVKCGTCLTCYKRKTAFLLNGINEEGYAKDPMKSEYAEEINKEMENLTGNSSNRFTTKRILEHKQLMELL